MMIDKLKYSDFQRRFHDGVAAEKRIPISGGIELTVRCNLKCRHCYLGSKQGIEELSAEQWRRIMDSLNEAGMQWLYFTGGEPLVRRRTLLNLFRYARKLGIFVTLCTNVTLMDDEIAGILAETGLISVEASIYGATEHTYEAVTGVRGSYRQFRRGLDCLFRKGVVVKLKTPMMTTNYHEIGEMETLTKQLGGVNYRFDGVITCQIEGGRLPTEFRLRPELVAQIELRHTQYRRFFENKIRKEWRLPTEAMYNYVCRAGLTCYYVSTEGKLAFCVLNREPAADLTSKDFLHEWNSSMQAMRMARPDAHSYRYECLDCSIAPLCSNCPAWSIMENRNINKKSLFPCEVAHWRAKKLAEDTELRSPLLDRLGFDPALWTREEIKCRVTACDVGAEHSHPKKEV